MDASRRYPKLRWPVDLQLHETSEGRLLVVRCPLGISEAPLILRGDVAPIVSSFDGSRPIEHILDQFRPQGVDMSLLDELISLLDANLYLASPRFFAAEREVRERFLASSIRPAALAGAGYAADPHTLRVEVRQYLAHGSPLTACDPCKLALIKVPHIDYRRGQICYGKSYSQVNLKDEDLVILIGTSHQYSTNLFHLTRKHFESPLGTVRCDQEFVETLAGQYGRSRSYADEFLHKREHSLELQLPFLAFQGRNISIVPILVGSFHSFVQSQKLPSSSDAYATFTGALTELVRSRQRQGQRVIFIAGVDMAHVGQFFGDQQPLTPELLQSIEARDQLYLDAISRMDLQGLFAHVVEDGDARRICGYPTMHTVLEVLERLGGNYQTTCYEYRQAVDYANDCAVTFAGMGVYHT